MALDVLFLTLEQLAIIFIFIAVGFFFGKRKMLPEDTGTALSRLILYLFIPCMSFISVARNFSLEKIRIYAIIMTAGVVVLLLTIPLEILLRKITPGTTIEKMTAGYSMILPNYGYIGYPLILAVFGQEVLSMFIIFVLPLNIYFGLVTVPAWSRSEKRKGISKLLDILTPTTVSVLLGVLWGVIGIPMPSILENVCDAGSGCVLVTTMLVTGLTISRIPLRKLFGDKRAYLIAAVRLILLPVVFAAAAYGVCKLLHLDSTLLLIVGAFMAMPLGMNPVILAEMQGKDGTFGAKCALVSLVMSIVTIPAAFELLSLIAGTF